jgi:ABC-type lipoprotein export system ATPase subunit
MTSSQGAPLVTVRAKNLDAGRCPFANEEIRFELRPGDCVRLAGVSGSGKSTLATYVAGLSNASKLRKNLGIDIDCRWDPTVPEGERCGALFQSTTLLDSHTV